MISTFQNKAPARRGESSRRRPIESQALKRLSGTKPIRILLAEDNATNQKVALAILNRLGCRADAVANGSEVLKAVQMIPYDLILMDCQMPEMDGYEATRRIRSLPGLLSRIPIVAMTANALKGDREKCLAAGMDDYVSKPVDPASLRSAIERIVLGESSGAVRQEEDAAPAAPEAEAQGKVELFDGIVQPQAHFDLEGIMERMENDTALIREIIPLFVKDFERNVVELEDYAKKRSGAVEASRMAHSLKGAAANAGAPGLRDVALALEKAFADSRFEDAEKLMKSFKDCFSEFRKSVASHGFL